MSDLRIDPRRRKQITLLIGTRFDYEPAPKTSMRTSGGLAPADRQPCTDCGGVLLRDDFGKTIKRQKGRGYVLDGFKRKQPCLTCGGRKPVGQPLEPGSGWIDRDPMAPREVIGSTSTQATTKPARTATCDRCGGTGVGGAHLRDLDDLTSEYREPCLTCNGSGRRVVATFDLQLDREPSGERWDGVDPEHILDIVDGRARSARQLRGSFDELDHALRGVYAHVNKPLRFAPVTVYARDALRMLDELYLPPATRDERDLTERERDLVELTLAYIDARMPDQIRVPAGAAANQRLRDDHLRTVRGRGTSTHALAQRDKEIRKLIRQDRPSHAVAYEFGLSVSQVNRIAAGGSEVA